MKYLTRPIQRVTIALGIGAAIAAGFLLSSYLESRNGCVRTLGNSEKVTGAQEVVYSWGCLQPQRFRRWSVIADRLPTPYFKPTDAADDRLPIPASKW